MRRTNILLALVCLSLLTTTCLNDSPSGPGSTALRLSIAAQISGQGANQWRVGIRVFYVRTTDEQVDLRVSPDEVLVDRGVSTTRDISVQIASCLDDPLRTNIGQGGCTLIVELKLLDESGQVLTQDSQQVHATAGQSVDPPPFNLQGSFILLSQSSVSFNAVQGGALPGQVIVGVSSSNGGSLGTLTTSVAYMNRAGWLRATPSPSQIAVQPDSTLLPPATYDAIVTVIPSNKAFPDRTFQVHYTVSAAGATGSISGVVRSSQTANPISAATAELRLGPSNTSGVPLSTTITSANGTYSFSGLQAGTYTVVAKATGFVDGSRGAIVVAGAPVANQDVILSPTLQAGQTRIVLTWGSLPGDLDAHLTGPTLQQRFHICHADRGSTTLSPFASLDNDETGGFGPETITITQQLTGTYNYYVYDYTNSPTPFTTPLTGSAARVQVFRGNALVNDFAVPTSGAGNLWTVFTLNGTTVTPVNTITTTTAVAGGCGVLPSSDGAILRKGGGGR